MSASTTILVTGATGLIGFRILIAALAAGHTVRFTARSEGKAHLVTSNPAVPNFDRLSCVIIPDLTVAGAFDSALEGVTYVIHAAAPVPMPYYDPMTEIFQPMEKTTLGLLTSALKTPSVKRIVITSSVIGNLGVGPLPTIASASTRTPLPDPFPSSFGNPFEAYTLGKMVLLHIADKFTKEHNPHFAISHVVPGYVFGRNELALDANMMQTHNSSNNFLIMGILGGEPPYPVHGQLAVEYKGDDVEKLLGRKPKSFEDAVLDAAD